ncbi:hypothetical protein EVAR_35785_1 [Eumeta japonica]|uniref:Uncharacterized protein n=1 Tax=Eumeta variegata TaxID=151549 RepID=A0A4C1WMB6_EUMVA|nr:hypothetical protein EVAR_35785_1 [Eumeta japonica]
MSIQVIPGQPVIADMAACTVLTVYVVSLRVGAAGPVQAGPGWQTPPRLNDQSDTDSENKRYRIVFVLPLSSPRRPARVTAVSPCLLSQFTGVESVEQTAAVCAPAVCATAGRGLRQPSACTPHP